jgi:hypothetical protein
MFSLENDRIVITGISKKNQEQKEEAPAAPALKLQKKKPEAAAATTKANPLKGKAAATGIKKCSKCGQEYKPTSNGQKYCKICKENCKKGKVINTKRNIKIPNFDQKELLDSMGLKKN